MNDSIYRSILQRTKIGAFLLLIVTGFIMPGLQADCPLSVNPILIAQGGFCTCINFLTLQAAVGGSPTLPISYTYMLTGANGFSQSVTHSNVNSANDSFQFGPLCGGCYSWTVNVSDSSSCTASLTNLLTIVGAGPSPAASISGNNSPYNIGDTVTLFGSPSTVNPPGPGLIYTWFAPDGTPIGFTQNLSFTLTGINPFTPGNYLFRVQNPPIFNCSAAGCEGDAFTLITLCAFDFSVTNTTTSCGSTTADVQVTGINATFPFTYILDGGMSTIASTNPFTIPGVAVGVPHVLTVTPAAQPNCVVTKNFTVTAAECCLGQPQFSNPQPTCPNADTGQVTFTVANALNNTFQYQVNGGPFQVGTNPVVLTNLPSNVTVVVQDGTVPPCSPVSNSITLPIFPPIIIDIEGQLDICGQVMPTLTAVPSGGAGGPYMFLWSTGDETAQINVSSPGPYSVTITDQAGCKNSASVMVNQELSAAISPADPFVCPGNSVTLNALPTPSGTYTYSWTNCENPTVISTASTVQVQQPGTYCVTIADPVHLPGCIAQASVTVNAGTIEQCGDLSLTLCCKKKVSDNAHSTIVVTVTNTGPIALSGIVVKDILPNCFALKRASGDGWSFIEGQTVIATFANELQPGISTSFRLCVAIDCDKPNCLTTNYVVNQVSALSSTTASRNASCIIKID